MLKSVFKNFISEPKRQVNKNLVTLLSLLNVLLQLEDQGIPGSEKIG